MSKTPEELHRKYISEETWLDPYLEIFLSEEEGQIIRRYCSWMEKLISREIPALTPAQERFLEVAKAEALPITKFEHAWVQYVFHRDGIDLVGKFYQTQ